MFHTLRARLIGICVAITVAALFALASATFVVVQYESEALYGETLRIDMTPMDFNKYGFDLVFRITDAHQGRAVARGKQGLVFTDPQERRVRLLPPALLARLGHTPA